MLTLSKNMENAFTAEGFDNWKKILRNSHESSHRHKEAVIKLRFRNAPLINLQLDEQIASTQQQRRQMLLRDKQLTILCLLARQGMAMRGHDEFDGNLLQFLLLRQEDAPGLNAWIKNVKYLSHDIVNECINLMRQTVTRNILAQIHFAKTYSIMADDTKDLSNKEQMSVCIRWVDEKFNIHKDFIGLFHVEKTTSEFLFADIKDILLRCFLPICHCRCYDGAANMMGHLRGVAAHSRSENPAAACQVHCFAHCRNLFLQDASKGSPIVRNSLNLVTEICNFVRHSPKRLAIFSMFQEESASKRPSLRPLDDLRAICYIIHHQVNMERVHLSDCGLSTHSMTYLEEYVGPENQIQKLNIKSNKKLGIEDMLSVVRLMKQGKLRKVIYDYQLTGLEKERPKSFLREPTEQVCLWQEEKRLNVEKTWKEAIYDGTFRLDEDKEIGKEGGTVEVGDCKVAIPAGALETATRICLELTMIPMKEGFIKITPTLKCYPSGIVFSKPVTISLQTWCISEEADIPVSVFCKPNDAEPPYLLATTKLKEGLVEFQCTHFTGFEAGVSKDDAGRVIYILKGIIAQNDRDFSILHYVKNKVTEIRAEELATQYQYNLKHTLNSIRVVLEDVMEITMSTNKSHEMYFDEESQDFKADFVLLESAFSVTRDFILVGEKFSNDVIISCERKIRGGSEVDVAKFTYKFGKAEERSASLGNEMVASGSVTSGRNTVQADRVSMSEHRYDVIDNFKEVDWLRFARNKLQLKESEIDKIQTDHKHNAVERKYQMLLLWGRRYEESEEKRQLEAFLKSPAGYQGPSETRRRTADPDGGKIAKKKICPACSL